MKVIRFVNESELDVYLSGGKLMNATQHSKYKFSTSVGFCFAELTEVRDANKWMRKLLCNTQCDYCIEFDTDEFKEPLNESKAMYSHDNDFTKSMEFREWCTTSYSLTTHPYIRLGKCNPTELITNGSGIKWLTRAEVEETLNHKN